MLRGAFAGAIEAAAYTALNPLDRPQALQTASALIYINLTFYWLSTYLSGMVTDLLLISERDWQRGVPRRARIKRVFRLSLGLEKLEGVSTTEGVLVWALRLVVYPAVPPLFDRWCHYAFGFSPIYEAYQWLRAMHA